MLFSSMNKGGVLFFLVLCCWSGFAQTKFEQIKDQADLWLKTTIEADPIPKSAKSKNIDYSNNHYYISGYFSKGILTEGQVLDIYDTAIEPKIILEGKVSYVGDRLLIKGIKYDYSEKGACCTYGSFYVSNSADDLFIYKPRKAQELKIVESDVYYYSGFYLDCPTIVSIVKPSIAVDGKTGGRGYTQFYAPLNDSIIANKGYDNIQDLLLSTEKNAVMEWAHGAVFNGTISPKINNEGIISFVLLAGEMTGYGHKSIKVNEYQEGYSLYMERIDDPNDTKLKSETIIVFDKSLIDQESYWDWRSYLDNIGELRIEYRNGDSYTGQALVNENLSDDGELLSYSYTLTTGVYKYLNGDSFEGDLSQDFFYGIPVSGITRFKDGTIKQNNWLLDYQLSGDQYSKLSQLRYPTAIRAAAEGYLYDSYKYAAKKAEDEGRYSVAKQYYLTARSIKPNAEKWEEILARIDKKIKEEEYRQMMIAQYGPVLGNKIIKGIVELGMTKTMVIDAFGTNDVLLHSYRVSQSTDWSGNRIEIWEYDFDKAKRYMDSVMGNAGISDLLFGLGSTLLGVNVRAEISNVVKYKYLRFNNDKLVEIRDNSYYDDVDNAMDSFNRLF